MKVLSLFDGMSCGRLALNKAGISVSKYYASELDKFAIAESSANFPDHTHMGDVTKWREWGIDWSSIDLVIGGTPCQGFSSAGKQGGTKAELNGETFIVSTRKQYLELKIGGANFLSCSHLFWEYVLILDHLKSVNPNVKFLLENVKMKKEYLAMITETLGVEPILINAALVSAQNRWRWYWCNWQTIQPVDKGVLLKDIIEEVPTDPTVMSDKFCKRNAHILRDDFNGKAKNLFAMEYVKNGRQGDYIAFAYNRKDGIKHEISKAYPLNASDWRGLNRNQTQNAVVCAAMRGRYDADGKIVQQLEPRKDGKTNCLTTVSKDNLVLSPASIVGRRINPETGCRDDYNKAIPLVQCLQVKHSADKMGCLTTVEKDCLLSESAPGRYTNAYNREDIHYRKLTVTECCRLQTVPDDYFKVSSNSQAYKMLGNGWCVDVIVHLFNSLVKDEQNSIAA